MNTIKLKPCPFCNNTIYGDEEDIHPTGLTWKYDQHKRAKIYGTRKDFKNTCWNIVCVCGATMQGDSKEEVITQWNTRTKQEDK